MNKNQENNRFKVWISLIFSILRHLSSRGEANRGETGKWRRVADGIRGGILLFSLPLLLSLIFILCRCMKIFPRNHPCPVFLHLHSFFRDNNWAGRAIIRHCHACATLARINSSFWEIYKNQEINQWWLSMNINRFDWGGGGEKDGAITRFIVRPNHSNFWFDIFSINNSVPCSVLKFHRHW